MWLFKNVFIGDLNNCALRDFLSHLRFCTRIYLFFFNCFHSRKYIFKKKKKSQAVICSFKILWKLNPDWKICNGCINIIFGFCLSYSGLVRFLGCPLNYNIYKWSYLFKSTQWKMLKYNFFETLNKAKNNMSLSGDYVRRYFDAVVVSQKYARGNHTQDNDTEQWLAGNIEVCLSYH